MHLSVGGNRYQWLDNWAEIPNVQGAQSGWAHPGMVVTESGEIVSFHPSDPQIMVFDQNGSLLRTWSTGFTEGHGITLVKEESAEYLWIADPGRKRRKDNDFQYPAGVQVTGQVVKMDLKGDTKLSLPTPPVSVYELGNYCPTSVVVNEERWSGNGDVWVADGYGESYVHRYDKAGEYRSSLTGQEGAAGRFSCPHGIWIDRRKSEPELYIADRSNRRVQVYDLEGGFKRSFGSEFLTSPSAFAADGDRLIVAELRARLAVLDLQDRLVGYLGDNSLVAESEGWPNVERSMLQAGKFNSPHGIAVDGDGNLYIAEWLIGGRFTKLLKS